MKISSLPLQNTKKIEIIVFILFGFLFFQVLFIRLLFLFGLSIGSYVLPMSVAIYGALLGLGYTFNFFSPREKKDWLIGSSVFAITLGLMAGGSILMAQTYDTSWDGQGYHQSAVIALAHGWNPLRESALPFSQRLPSQIFAESYPAALWEVQANIYALTNQINSAKVVNLYILILAFLASYTVLRKLALNHFLSFLTSFLIVFQPVFILQMLTFMQDGFGYQLVVIAVASLILITLTPKSYWPISIFVMAEIFLVSTKYSHLPIALVLGFIFIAIIGNRFLNKDYRFSVKTILVIVSLTVVSLLFATIPYFRNYYYHRSLFYPTNIPQLMGAVRYNNVPQNLAESNKGTLLVYGIFSSAQDNESGNPLNPTNQAYLKIPFTFSWGEVKDSVSLYNNRVGAGGPLFSGIILLSVLLLVYVSFKSKKKPQRYAVYSIYFGLVVIVTLSLAAPTPNLLRYVNQLQLVPFFIILPLYKMFAWRSVKLATYLVLALITLNISLYTTAYLQFNYQKTLLVKDELTRMRESGLVYQVQAQQLYSNYILLQENGVKAMAVGTLTCENGQPLHSSSNTTHYCAE